MQRQKKKCVFVVTWHCSMEEGLKCKHMWLKASAACEALAEPCESLVNNQCAFECPGVPANVNSAHMPNA